MDYEAVIVGSGVIGLAIARELSIAGINVLVVEKNHRSGEEISSRNSGVIHAGMYYPSNSLKATFCVLGNSYLYDYVNEKGISYKKTGKLIVASSKTELEKLKNIYSQGLINGVSISMLSSNAVKEIEPNINCIKAIHSPNTGIIDVPEYITSLEGDIQHNNSYVSFNTEFISAKRDNKSFITKIKSNNDTFEISSKFLINSAGLHSENILHNLKGINKKNIHKIYYGKGHYFKYSGKNPFNHLIYPIPSPGGLGIHVGMDIGGQLRFGPDIDWIDCIDYSFDESLKKKFIKAIKSYWPSLNEEKLQPDYTGIRPKLSSRNESPKDFIINSETNHGIQGFISLEGIESPGLTSSMAIGKYVSKLLLKN